MPRALPAAASSAAFTASGRKHKLAPPELNVPMRIGELEIEADCLWREQRLIVELDHRSTHARRKDFDKDRRRDRIVQAAGWRLVRVTDTDLHGDEANLAADLTALLGVAV
jgi:very-short-patch-repair endonuclease